MKKEAVDNTASFLFVCLFATNYSATVLYNVSGVVDVVVYADVLLVVNLFVNYLLLMCSSRIMKRQTSRLRLLLGASIGAVYGLVIFLPELPHVVELLLRVVATALIVFGTFGFKNIRYFLRSFFTFFAVSIAFGGIIFVMWVTVAPVGLVYENGAVYFDIDMAVLAISTVISFIVVSTIAHFTARRAPKDSVAMVRIHSKGRSVSATALIDTGNSLCESFSGFPVVLGESDAMEKILPESVRAFLNGEDITASPEIRLIMHKTVSGTGVLPAFRPDLIEVKTVSCSIKTNEVYVAVTKNNLANGEYELILNPALFYRETV